ncbi:transcriptional regulator [Acinetobacter venetianus]|uniref:HTH cro/C1-type domain-containing protein n=1 Tax=Acinetobacter venetianus TaxID=52133 RepID=A0A150I1C3_9GAMM|nr:transcriptional regulator [Acinetobacter venetianus]KXZ73386.1 hypothetical protein AVENLUH13518_00002 [Acinetobacter venetianus]
MKEFKEKEAFSQRLKQLLLARNWPTNSPTWLAKEFNIRFSGNSVSVQTANNWLLGNAIPSQDKLQILAAWLNVSTHWLRFGETDLSAQQDFNNSYKNIQLYMDDLPKKIAKLTPKQKQLVYNLVEELLLK